MEVEFGSRVSARGKVRVLLGLGPYRVSARFLSSELLCVRFASWLTSLIQTGSSSPFSGANAVNCARDDSGGGRGQRSRGERGVGARAPRAFHLARDGRLLGRRGRLI